MGIPGREFTGFAGMFAGAVAPNGAATTHNNGCRFRSLRSLQ